MSYERLDTNVDLPAMEREILARWRERSVFERSLAQTADGPTWTAYEGPPTANGKPGLHHVEARSFKDAFPRYRTMKGYHVPRRAGWDCHGLPVELEVEKSLGLGGKRDIEAFGIAEFNQRCRDSVLAYVTAWQDMTERMGYWVDFDDAYRTMDARYVESVWWALQRIHDRGLLVEDYRVAPYCPRCQTALSSHELGQPGAYADVTSPSVFVRLPITSGPWADEADLLIWTTTPWTLVSNTAVAVHAEVTYVRVRPPGGGRNVVVAEPLVALVLGEGWEVVAALPGSGLAGASYRRPFDLVDIPDAHRVLTADFVTTAEGTGLVHLAPAFGADDLEVCRRHGLAVVNPVQRDGRFESGLALVGGLAFAEANSALITDLRDRELLVREQPHRHSYPHCWRCHSALLYYAMPSWYIRTTAIRDELTAENDRTNWHPANLKDGRYGHWLANNVDWALSRSRYWGTPLPIWRCADRHAVCVGSLAELGKHAGRDLSGLDPHRPFVDDITLDCPTCGDTATRVPEVIDVWFDSGAMPFAQWGAPHRGDEEFTRSYPAQFICEGIDQTRGWFYTLMAIGTLVFGRSSYENVLVLGLLLDGEGRKMSKHIGNVLEPISLMDRHGADAVRWFMLASGSPWGDRRVSHEAIEEGARKVILTYWNTAAFHTLYAGLAGWRPGDGSVPPATDRPVMDRWVLAELAATITDVDRAMDGFDTQRAATRLAGFVDDLSNWYVRRSRRRFWEGDPAALATLHECLDALTRMLAPLLPFVTDRVWQATVAATDPAAPDSVHLAAWPEDRPDLLDPDLAEQMALVRRVVELGRTTRAESGVKIRQPLARGLVAAPGWDGIAAGLRAEIAAELNVLTLDATDAEASIVDHAIRPQFRALGKRFGSRTQQVAQTIRDADPEAMAAALRRTGQVELSVDGETVVLTSEEIEVTQTPRTGWAVASRDGITVALDTTITPELRRAGLARDVMRALQQARKNTGLQVSDRVTVWWHADGETAIAVREHAPAIAEEILATTFTEAPGPVDLHPESDPSTGLTYRLRIA